MRRSTSLALPSPTPRERTKAGASPLVHNSDTDLNECWLHHRAACDRRSESRQPSSRTSRPSMLEGTTTAGAGGAFSRRWRSSSQRGASSKAVLCEVSSRAARARPMRLVTASSGASPSSSRLCRSTRWTERRATPTVSISEFASVVSSLAPAFAAGAAASTAVRAAGARQLRSRDLR
eukprot:scaffold179579_cov30-Tisochrysis_lutea.AAC.3